ncbi:MAG: dual specificity protein phosphatase family protein [Pirellulales bacterium]|nr:dual specificity protein phosphatase family protein [Pirellulales bacterium]
MPSRRIVLPFVILCLVARSIAAEPTRPAKWAQPLEVEGVPNLHKVSDKLYRSAQPTAEGMKNLKEMGVKTVVTLRSFHSDRKLLGDTGLGYEHIHMKAWHPEEKEAVRFLKILNDPDRRPVLVHCQHGADRTGTMCALYRIAVEGWTEEEAIREMTEGGYGFHSIFSNLPTWIRDMDIDALRRKAGLNQKKAGAQKADPADADGKQGKNEKAPTA